MERCVLLLFGHTHACVGNAHVPPKPHAHAPTHLASSCPCPCPCPCPQVVGLSEHHITNVDMLCALCEHAASARSTGQTGANDESSRWVVGWVAGGGGNLWRGGPGYCRVLILLYCCMYCSITLQTLSLHNIKQPQNCQLTGKFLSICSTIFRRTCCYYILLSSQITCAPPSFPPQIPLHHALQLARQQRRLSRGQACLY